MGSSGSRRSSAVVSEDAPRAVVAGVGPDVAPRPGRGGCRGRAATGGCRGLAQDRAGPGHVGQGQVGPAQLQPGLDRVVGHGVGQLWPQPAARARCCRPGPGRPGGWPSGPPPRTSRADDVVSRCAGLHDHERLLGQDLGLVPFLDGPMARMDARPGRRRRPASPRRRRPPRPRRPGAGRPGRLAGQQVGDPLQQDAPAPATGCPGSARPRRPARRPASARTRGGTAWPAAAPPSSRSVLPSGSVPR